MDWIEGFLEYSEGSNCPDIFRLWSAISAIAGCMERRLAVYTAQGPIYANQFILLVATPGVGKSEAIKKVSRMWYKTTKLHVAPDSLTQASVIDSLAEAERKIVIPGDILEYHCLNVTADELGVFVPAYETDFLSKLTKIYDNPEVYRERRRHFNAGKELQIIAPQMNLLCGSQPAFLSSLLPDYAWSQGFMSRFLMVYSEQKPLIDLFNKPPAREELEKALLKRMAEWSEMLGHFTWDPACAQELQKWYASGCNPVPGHARLVHYNARRLVHCIKLTMVASLSRSNDLIITPDDFDRALGWLLTAEQKMPDVFRAMEGKNDGAVIMDLHWYMWNQYTKDEKKTPFHESALVNFLTSRTTSDKVIKIIDLAERGGVIARVAGQPKFYIPRPSKDFGME